jgi:hypothetical protein
MSEELARYFAQFVDQPRPEPGSPPLATSQFKLGELDVTGSRLIFSDSCCAPMDGVPVLVPPGRYELLVDCISYGGASCIARLIVQLPGSLPERGDLLGRFAVDAASAGVCDGDVLKGFAVSNEAAHHGWLEALGRQQADCPQLAGFFAFPDASTTLFHVRSGFGDGLYPVYVLRENGSVVGAEAVFVSPTQGFDQPEVEAVAEEEMVVLHLEY